MTDQVSTRLGYIQEELGAIVDERIQALEAVLQNAERMTRRLMKAEMEIEHLNSNEGELTLQSETLETQMETVRARMAQSQRSHDALLAERDQLRSDQESLIAETTALRDQVEALRATVETVEDEANSLRSENTGLRTKAKALQENVTRMRQLRDELMSSISGLTQQMSGLAGGEPE
jgi:chromosome segregation ATPase